MMLAHSDETKQVLDTCRGVSFAELRDQAIVRMLANTGARLSEVASTISSSPIRQ